jgi:hypothetical protein
VLVTSCNDVIDKAVCVSRRGLQRTLGIIGGVATVAGLSSVVQGAGGVLQGGKVSANVDSEFRFYATWYAVLGVLVLRAARHPESEATVVRACGAGFFLAGCSRILSATSVGEPHKFFKVLTGIELAIPALIIPWQNRAARSWTLKAK